MRLTPFLAIAGAALALAAIQLLAPRQAAPTADVPAAAISDAAAKDEEEDVAPAATATDEIPERADETAASRPDSPAPDLEAAQRQEVKAGLAYLDAVRAIPGAAPLLDDIVGYLKNDDSGDFSIEGLATDANGLAVVDQSADRQMIKDPEIRAKWAKLMALIAANGEK